MTECTWEEPGTWNPSKPVDGDTIHVTYTTTTPTGDDVPGAGTYNFEQTDDWNDPIPQAEDYIGAGEIGTISLSDDSNLSVASNFDTASLLNAAGNLLYVSGDCTCSAGIGIGGGMLEIADDVTLTADVDAGTTGVVNVGNGTLAGTLFCQAGGTPTVDIGASGRIEGIINAGGECWEWNTEPGAVVKVTIPGNFDAGAQHTVVLDVGLEIAVDGVVVGVGPLGDQFGSLLIHPGCTLDGGGFSAPTQSGEIRGTGSVANIDQGAGDPNHIDAAEGIHDGGGNVGVIFHKPGGTGTHCCTGT